jgi:hypothetical protein
MSRLRYSVSRKQAIAVYRRVLRLANAYIGRQRQSLLVTDGRALMTWGEIRLHIRESLSLKIKEDRCRKVR